MFLADCPARTTLALVGHTWSVAAIVALGERPRRYSKLLERIRGISKKMLTQTLHKLARNIKNLGATRMLRAFDPNPASGRATHGRGE